MAASVPSPWPIGPQEAAFERATCRVRVERDSPDSARLARWTAHVDVAAGGALRPLVFADGRRVAIHGPSEPVTFNSAVAFLAEVFGPISEPPHDWIEWHPLTVGEPFVLGPSPGRTTEA